MYQAPNRKLKLVILDDDPSIVRLLSVVVQENVGQWYEPFTFTDPRKVCQWLDRHCADVLLTDIEMPGMDGLDMLRLAKGRNAWTQVIMLTAHSTWDRMGEAIESGASDYLLKPIDRRELVQLLEQSAERCARWQAALVKTLRPALLEA